MTQYHQDFTDKLETRINEIVNKHKSEQLTGDDRTEFYSATLHLEGDRDMDALRMETFVSVFDAILGESKYGRLAWLSLPTVHLRNSGVPDIEEIREQLKCGGYLGDAWPATRIEVEFEAHISARS